MVIEYIRYRVPAERAEAFEAAYGQAQEALRAAAQCLDYELSRCLEDPDSFTLRITWTSVEDHLRGFRGGPEFPRFLAAVAPYLDDIEEMRHYRRTPVVGAGGGAPPSLYDWAGGNSAFVARSSVIWSGAPGWRCSIRSRTPTRSGRRRCPAGAGASPRRTRAARYGASADVHRGHRPGSTVDSGHRAQRLGGLLRNDVVDEHAHP